MSIIRVRTELSGFAGAPGLMTQYFSPAVAVPNQAISQLAVDRVRDALTAGAQLFPAALTWRVQGQADVLDEATGQLVDSFNVTERNGTGGVAGTNFGPLPVGACVTWLTASFKAGRRVAGRTFLVPLTNTAFEQNGTLAAAALTNVGLFADSMNNAGATDLVFVVWSRPVLGAGGSKHGVVGHRTADKAAVLRSRRQ